MARKKTETQSEYTLVYLGPGGVYVQGPYAFVRDGAPVTVDSATYHRIRTDPGVVVEVVEDAQPQAAAPGHEIKTAEPVRQSQRIAHLEALANGSTA